MSIYNKFRSIGKIADKYSLSKRFDEPTYFSFRLMFGTNQDETYNYANEQVSYDVMPHPLFNTLSRTSARGASVSLNLPVIRSIDIPMYSAIEFLENSNEPTRAKMLKEFIEKFNDLQNNYPYYFQQIDGVSDLLKIDTTKGQRITNDKRIIITCLEGLDLRMTYLINLYRKIVWDDTYQRWVLPDMMRYFTLKIYLAEFRSFHVQQDYNAYGINLKEVERNFNSKNIESMRHELADMKNVKVNLPKISTNPNSPPMYLKVLDDILPTWEITCEMCEFDISDIEYTHLTSLNVAGDPPQGAVKFGIKIGNIKETQIYPLFQHMYLIDRKINGRDRAKEEISTTFENNIKQLYPTFLQIAQTREQDPDNDTHGSGLSYNERQNYDTTQDTRDAIPKMAPSERLNTQFYNDRSGEMIDIPFDPTIPDTWIGNAISWGTGFARHFIRSKIDKAKITTIPSIGLSFSEITAALRAKNLVGALGMIRKGVNEVTKQYENAPSSRLEGPIQTDEIMKEFLTTLVHTETDSIGDEDSQLLKMAAQTALNDKKTWNDIIDYSLQTNINENDMAIGAPKTIEGGGLEVVPPFTATRGKIDAASLLRGDPTSSRLSGEIEATGFGEDAPSSKLEGRIDSTFSINVTTSEKLGTKIDGNLDSGGIASGMLGSKIPETVGNRGKTSEKLGTRIDGNLDRGGYPSDKLGTSIDEELSRGGKPSDKLGSTIDDNRLERPAPGIKMNSVKIENVLEEAPSSGLGSKIEGQPFKQPDPNAASTQVI